MRGKYLMVVTLIAFLIMAAVLAFSFSTMSAMAKGDRSQIPSVAKVESYGRQVLAKVNEFASPVLGTFGISLDGSNTTDEVTRHLQEAASSVDEAMKKISR